MKKKIAVDLDGVTWNCHPLLVDIYNKQNNTNYTNEDINCWDFFPEYKFWPAYDEMVTRIDEFPIMDYRLPFFMTILNSWFDVSFLTHGKYTKERVKKKLKRWEIIEDLDYKNIIIDNNNNSKANHGFDYYIDDNPNLALDIIQRFTQKQMLLFDSPWNRSFDCSKYKNITRVKNWSEIMDFFEQEKVKLWKNVEHYCL